MKLKVLVICVGGNCRSPGIATVLKGTYNVDALSASAYWQEPETMLMLCRWADKIVLVEGKTLSDGTDHPENQRRWSQCVMWQSEFDLKRIIFDVGRDVWGNPLNETYHELINSRIHEILQ